jgi:hypothetical protein
MDLAYDHIQEEAFPPEPSDKQEKKPETTLNADFQEAYKAISSSPWGAKLGGFFGNVVKQVDTTLLWTTPKGGTDGSIGRICLQGSTTGAERCW